MAPGGLALAAWPWRPGPGGLALAHIGDTRAYLLRGGELLSLTQDHAWVQASGRCREARLYDQGELDNIACVVADVMAG